MGETTEFLLNVGWHVTILSVILVSFFYFYISKLTASHVHEQIDSVLETKIPQLLDQITLPDSLTGGWSHVALVSQRMKGLYDEQDLYTNYHNKVIMIVSISVIIVMLISMIFLSYIYKDQANLGLIAKENIIIFTFIGILEYLFFTRIASKIIPVYPDDMSRTIKDAVRNNIKNLN